MAESPGDVDLLLRHGRVITVDADRRVLRDGAIAIQGGRITAIGPDEQVSLGVSARTVRDLGGAVVHPGLVDAHAHTNIDLIRGLTPEATADWSGVELPYFASRNPQQEHLSTMLACMEMVANGITTYADTGGSFSDLSATVGAIEIVGMRGMPGSYIADMPTKIESLQITVDECFRRLEAQLAAHPFHGDQRVRCAVTLSGMGMASDRLLTEAKALADQRQVPMIMHQSWDEEEVAIARERFGRRPVEHLADLGILGPNLSLVHMIQINDAEVGLVAEAGTNVIHCPSASIRRAMGAIRVGRFPDMMAAGITVALGSDGHSGKHDIARQAYLAATLHREARNTMPIINAYTAMEMATLNGAKALGLDYEIGSLEVGKRADLVIHRLDRPEIRPRFQDPVKNLVYHSLAQAVGTVIVDGETIFDDGRFTRFDAADAYERLDAAAARLEAEIAPHDDAAWPLA